MSWASRILVLTILTFHTNYWMFSNNTQMGRLLLVSAGLMRMSLWELGW